MYAKSMDYDFNKTVNFLDSKWSGTEATATTAAMDVDTPGRVRDFKRDSHGLCKAIARQVCTCARGGRLDEIT